ncbi:hypothetical protein GCM10010403_51340 [Glycomyces rutgersensis]|uniref:Phage integrase family protein n=1 Tax=Glycomyces rutgersensis TaxID=58115 RepID=A0ABN3GG59_9ACTN
MGHKDITTTWTVYRHQLRPVTEGADLLDEDQKSASPTEKDFLRGQFGSELGSWPATANSEQSRFPKEKKAPENRGLRNYARGGT